MTVLIDSWAWIEYFKGTENGIKVREIIESPEEKITSTINISEVCHYILRMEGEMASEESLKFIIESSFIIPLNVSMSFSAAKIKHEKKMGLADAIVLATANSHEAKILTGDIDFKNERNVIYLGK